MKKSSVARSSEDPVGHESDPLPTFNADVSISCLKGRLSQHSGMTS
jgi:hypothetical protein